MAKKKVKMPSYYAYYNIELGDVTGVTCYPEANSSFIEIPADVADRFLTGVENYSNYVVSLVKKNGRQVKGLVEKQVVTYTPRLGIFDRIYEGASTQDLIIEWNFPNKEWIISLNTSDVVGVDSKFLFFVTAERDFNQLVRTIPVELSALTTAPVHIPFIADAENDINKLEILSKLVLGSYGLKITHE